MGISIVVSTFNGEKWIEEQLRSLTRQTRLADEVIIIDDASNDKTVSVIEQFIKKRRLEKTWSLLINQTNEGWKRNFYNALCLAKEDIIFLCDQDDIWDNDKLETMSYIMEKKQNIEVLACSYVPFDERGKVKVSHNIKRTMRYDGQLKKICPNEKFLTVLRPGCTYALRKSFFNKIRFKWVDDVPHDGLIWCTAVLMDSCFILDCNLVWWRKHKDSSSSIETISGENKDLLKKRYLFEISRMKEDIAIIDSLIRNDEINDVNKKYAMCALKNKSNMVKAYLDRSLSLVIKSYISHPKYFYSIVLLLRSIAILFFAKVRGLEIGSGE